MNHDDDDVLDIDDAIMEEGEEKMPDGFHATDPETGLPVPEEDEDESF